LGKLYPLEGLLALSLGYVRLCTWRGIDYSASMHPQGEGPDVVIHSYAAAHERPGTRSTARITANTNTAKAASMITADLFILNNATAALLLLSNTLIEGNILKWLQPRSP